MMLRPVHAAADVLAVRGAIPSSSATLDAQIAAVLLYGIEQGYLAEADVAPLLTPRGLRGPEDAHPHLDAVAKGMGAELEAAANRIADGIVPDGAFSPCYLSGCRMTSGSIPRWKSPPSRSNCDPSTTNR